MKKRSKFPAGWDEKRVRRVVEHYESQPEEQAVAEDEAPHRSRNGTLMEVPQDLIPKVREMIARRKKNA